MHSLILYTCNKINKKAGIKTACLKIENIAKFSFKIKMKRATQLTAKPDLSSLFCEVLKTCITAIKETIINKKSIVFHHVGLSEQQAAEQLLTIKINGVAKQCNKHNPLARIPK